MCTIAGIFMQVLLCRCIIAAVKIGIRMGVQGVYSNGYVGHSKKELSGQKQTL